MNEASGTFWGCWVVGVLEVMIDWYCYILVFFDTPLLLC